MNNYFKFSLPGWKLFLALILPVFLFGIIMGIFMFNSTDISNPFSNMFNMIPIQIVAGFITLLLYYVYIKLIVDNISHREGEFSFRGNFGRFAWIVIRDGLLSLATLGIYSFWLTENLLSYVFSNSQFGEKKFEFHSKGGELFKKFLFIMVPLSLPYYYFNFKQTIGIFFGQTPSSDLNASILISYFIFMAGSMIYSYKRLAWMLNISCDDYKIDLATEFWGTVRFLLLQLSFCVLTLGLYIPAAITKINKYYINCLYIRSDLKEIAINNSVPVLKSWGYIWGQFLLCIITLGIYMSWAATGIMRWFIESTEFEGFEEIVEIDEEPEALMIEENIEEAVSEEFEKQDNSNQDEDAM